jgi:hypothetical protein
MKPNQPPPTQKTAASNEERQTWINQLKQKLETDGSKSGMQPDEIARLQLECEKVLKQPILKT